MFNVEYEDNYFPERKFKLFNKFVSLSVPCFFSTFVFYCQYVCRALSVENVCNETSRQSDNGPRNVHKNHLLAKQNRSSRQSRCVVTANLQVQCSTLRLSRRPQAGLNLYRNSLIEFGQINLFAISV